DHVVTGRSGEVAAQLHDHPGVGMGRGELVENGVDPLGQYRDVEVGLTAEVGDAQPSAYVDEFQGEVEPFRDALGHLQDLGGVLLDHPLGQDAGAHVGVDAHEAYGREPGGEVGGVVEDLLVDPELAGLAAHREPRPLDGEGRIDAQRHRSGQAAGRGESVEDFQFAEGL